MGTQSTFKKKTITPGSILCFFFAILCTKLSAETIDEEQLITGNWYQVEVLIFRYNTGFEATQEKWPQKIDRSFPAKLSILDNNDNSAYGAFTTLPSAEHSFSNYLVELERRKKIKPLYHVAWRQPRIDKSMAHPLLIQAEKSPRMINLNWKAPLKSALSVTYISTLTYGYPAIKKQKKSRKMTGGYFPVTKSPICCKRA